MKEYVVKEKSFQVKPFGRVEMHDPSYGEPEKMDKMTMDICAFCSFPVSNRAAGVILQEIHGTLGGKEYPWFMVRFFSYRKDVDLARKEVAAECSNKCYPKLIREEKTLGCDTAEFAIRVDDRELVIQTLSDGSYGRMARFKDNYAIYLEFCLDGDAADWAGLEERIRYLFKVKAESDTWSGRKFFREYSED